MVQKVVEHVERWKRVEKGGIPVGIGGNRVCTGSRGASVISIRVMVRG